MGEPRHKRLKINLMRLKMYTEASLSKTRHNSGYFEIESSQINNIRHPRYIYFLEPSGAGKSQKCLISDLNNDLGQTAAQLQLPP